METGCQWAPLLGAGCAWWIVSWLCAWCKEGVGAGCWCWVLSAGCARGGYWRQGAGCWLCACGAVSWRAGAGCWRWLCGAAGLLVFVVCVVQIGCWRRVLALAVRVVETRHAVLRVKIGAAANAGCSPEIFLHAFAIWGLCWSNCFSTSAFGFQCFVIYCFFSCRQSAKHSRVYQGAFRNTDDDIFASMGADVECPLSVLLQFQQRIPSSAVLVDCRYSGSTGVVAMLDQGRRLHCFAHGKMF